MLIGKTLSVSMENLPKSRHNMMIVVFDELDATSGNRYPVGPGPVKTQDAVFLVSENESSNSLQIILSEVFQERNE